MATLINSGLGAWAARTTPLDTEWNSVAWSPVLDLFVAVSYSGRTSPVLTSPDGVTWTARAAGSVTHIWNDVIWVADLALFIAVSDLSGLSTNAMTSPDGINWTLRATPVQAWIACAWNGTTLVAVSSDDSTANVMTSTNGTAWTMQVSSGIPFGLEYIAWSPTLSLFVGSYQSGGIYSSANGIDWTLRETPPASSCMGRVVWADALATFLVLGGTTDGIDGGAVYVSTNGTTWIRNDFGTGALQSPDVLAWAESIGLIVVIQAGTATYLTSTNGSTFTSRTGLSSLWYDAVWSPDLGVLAAVSIDGVGTANIASATYVTAPSVTGLSHLEGASVAVTGDGIVLASPNNPAYTPIVVTGGAITLPAGTYTRVVVGLPITVDLETLDIDRAGSSMKDAGINVKKVGLWLEESMTPFVAQSLPASDTSTTGMQQMPMLDEEENVTTDPISGYRNVNIDGAWTNRGRIALRHVDPTPLAVLAIVASGDFGRG